MLPVLGLLLCMSLLLTAALPGCSLAAGQVAMAAITSRTLRLTGTTLANVSDRNMLPQAFEQATSEATWLCKAITGAATISYQPK